MRRRHGEPGDVSRARCASGEGSTAASIVQQRIGNNSGLVVSAAAVVGVLGVDDVDKGVALRAARAVAAEKEPVLVALERGEADVAPFVAADACCSVRLVCFVSVSCSAETAALTVRNRDIYKKGEDEGERVETYK